MGDVAVRNPVTGEFRMVAEADAASFVEQTGWHVADEAQRLQGARLLEHGTTGQQALATAETAVRTGTLGLVPGLPGHQERAAVLREESPYIAGAAQAVGALAPALLTGGVAGAAAGAAGLGARGAAVAAAATEGLVGGAAEEIEQARAEMRDVSVGNIMLYGLGGEVVGRALPAALKMGSGRVRAALTAAEEVAGEGVPSALAGAEVRSVEAEARLAREMPTGSDRTAALGRTADRQYEELSKSAAESAEQVVASAEAMTGSNKRIVDRMRASMPDASPAQMDWTTNQKLGLDFLSRRAADTPELAAYGKRIEAIVSPGIRRMDKAKTIADEFLAARDMALQLQGVGERLAKDANVPQTLRDELAAIVTSRVDKLKAGLRDESLFGGAARIEADLARGAEGMARGAAELQALSSPAKMRAYLRADRADRAALSSKLDETLDGVEDLLRAHETHGTLDAKDIAEQRERIGKIRAARSLADEVKLAAGAPEPVAPPPKPGSAWREGADFVAENVAEMLPFGGKLYRLAKRLRGMHEAGRAASKQTARKLAGVAGSTAEQAAEGIGMRDVAKAAAEELAPGPTAAYQRARAIIDRRRATAGSVDVGASAPVPLTGDARKSAVDLYSRADTIADSNVIDADGAYRPAAQRKLDDGVHLTETERTALFDYLTDMDGAIRASNPRVDAAMRKLTVDNPTQHGPLYRGLAVKDPAAFDGEFFTTEALTSTAFSPDAARSYIVPENGKPTLLVFRDVPAGAVVPNKVDREVVLPKGQRYRILKRETDGDVAVIHLTSADASAGAARAGERGFADAGAAGVRGILTSPMALTAGAGAAALAAYPLARSALERFTGDYSGPEEAFAAKRKILDQELVSPDVLYETLGASLEDLPKLSPELYQQVAARVASKVRFVRENLPPGIQTTLMYPNGTPPSMSTLREFAVLWNTTMDPYSVLEDIDAGTATGQQMRLLEGSDNDVYEQLRADVVEEIGRNFRSVPLSTKLQMDILFNADGLAGPFFSSKAADMIAAANEGQKKRGPGPRGDDIAVDELGSMAGPGGLSAIQSSVTNRGGGA